MENLRKPSKVILSNGKTLKEVLELHNKWLKNEEGGEKADLNGEDLSNVNLKDVNLSYANLSNANLKHVNLNCANLSNTNLSDANLKCANLSYNNLSYTNLSYTILSYTNLEGANLSYTNLKCAILKCANLSYTNLKGANLRGTNLENCKFYLTILYKCKGNFVSVGNIGSRNDTTHYFYKDDRVICGCFDGTMKQFEEKVKEAYKEDEVEYKEYMIAIRTLKELAKIELER